MSDERPPLTTTTSLLPAAIVLGIAVVTLVAFLALNFIASPSVKTPKTTIPIVIGTLGTEDHSTLLAGCRQPDNPPANVTDALLVPATTTATGPVRLPDQGAGDFDCMRALKTQASSRRLLGYYSAQLEARGWALFSKGASNGSPQLLFQKAGTDGFYWVVGITVNDQAASSSDWTYTIYQNSETI